MNPAPGIAAFTSRRSAEEQRDRGHGVFLSETEFRLFDGPEAIVERETSREMERDRAYWRDVAVERGGAEVHFEWHSRMSNGYNGMEGRPVVVEK